jgi:histidinol-phosphate/aromatic aminotransferase/cobyric acid decarboxylase-like protein
MATLTPLPPPGPHGGDAASVAAAFGLDPDEVLDLSQSLNPLAPDVVPVLRPHLASVRRYPDAARATAVLAEVMGVDERRLLLTNGGSEAIRLVGEEMGGHVIEPEFSLHPRTGGPLWRSNPHNPSGRLAGDDEHAGVWDEAFYPLATGRWTRGDARSVVVGSLTKLLACPGLRVGYILVPEAEVALLMRCSHGQPTWSVNGLAASALPDLLAGVDLPGWSEGVRELRSRLVAVLRAHGLDPQPSDANWVLVEAPGLRARLAPHGVVVRDCTSFGLPGWARIAVAGPVELERLDDALSSMGRITPEKPRPITTPPSLLVDGVGFVAQKGAP